MRKWLGIVVSCGLSMGVSVAVAQDAVPTTQEAPREATADSADQTRLPEVVVRGRSDSLLGIAQTASQGTVGAEQLSKRPLMRPGEVVETVPGAIVTQHSGAGKANQFFLRGFNLDHGTDFATTVNGMPVNLPTHGHGQGYTDLNFMIPELIERVDFKKGPYFVEEGDFASAGAIDINYFDVMDKGLFLAEGGMYGYGRTVFADSTAFGMGNLLYGVELFHNDGPWDHADSYDKLNAILRYSQGNRDSGFRITGMSYVGDWNATDQVPQRAIDSGLIDRFGSIDDSTGGKSQRHSLAAQFYQRTPQSYSDLTLYSYYYKLNLWSNFTYFLDDPVNGDQFEQADERVVSGLKAAHTLYGDLFGKRTENTFGLQVRNDVIRNGLFRTADRDILATTRSDRVIQTSVGGYYRNETQWAEKIRTVGGVRGDAYFFDVDSNLDANSGNESSSILSPKGSIIFGPWYKTEFYLSGGFGFHSNDGRGTTTTIDPGSGTPLSPVDPLVRTKGAEIGVRTLAVKGLQSSAALWILDIDSELLFTGDAGTTDPSRPSRRYGVEFANYYTPVEGITFDADLSLSKSRFTDSDPAGDDIPGSVESVLAAGVTVDNGKGWFGSLRLRYFGPRALIEDGSIESDATALVDASVGYRFNDTWTLRLELFNLLDTKDNDIEYYYASRLSGEPAGPDDGGFNDIHLHPVEPFGARLGLIARF